MFDKFLFDRQRFDIFANVIEVVSTGNLVISGDSQADYTLGSEERHHGKPRKRPHIQTHEKVRLRIAQQLPQISKTFSISSHGAVFISGESETVCISNVQSLGHTQISGNTECSHISVPSSFGSLVVSGRSNSSFVPGLTAMRAQEDAALLGLDDDSALNDLFAA
jgi:hypothetical protein